MKQLMDWLSNLHSTPDTGMLTYLLLSSDKQAKGDHSCPVQRCFEEFTSHQLDLSRPTEHMNPALIRSEAHMQRRSTNHQVPDTKILQFTWQGTLARIAAPANGSTLSCASGCEDAKCTPHGVFGVKARVCLCTMPSPRS